MRDLVPVSYKNPCNAISFQPHFKPARIEPSTESHVPSASLRRTESFQHEHGGDYPVRMRRDQEAEAGEEGGGLRAHLLRRRSSDVGAGGARHRRRLPFSESELPVRRGFAGRRAPVSPATRVTGHCLRASGTSRSRRRPTTGGAVCPGPGGSAACACLRASAARRNPQGHGGGFATRAHPVQRRSIGRVKMASEMQ